MSSLKSSPPSHPQARMVTPGFPVDHQEHHHHHHHYHHHLQHSATWSTNFCHCCDDPQSCRTTFFCPCVTFGRIAVFADEGSSSCVAKGALYCLAAALTCWFLGGAHCCGFCYRGRLRSRFNWKQSACGDCCVHCFCHCCALCQEYRHLKSLNYDPAKGWEANRQMPSGAMGMTQPPMMNNMSQQS